MHTRTIGAIVFALLMVLAGCTGGITPGAGGGAATTDDAKRGGGTATTATALEPDTDGGAVNFYVSDEPNDIDDFEHLNVTITKVAFQYAGGDDGNGSGDGAGEDANESDDEADESGDDGAGESGGWIERDVDNRTVDLTRLKGANATLVGSFDVPNGSYTKVFLYVDEIDATLAESGESANVKLPSERLHLNEGFTVGANSSPNFVFDIAVHEAGKSGKYILKPVASESGTDVPIETRDGNGPPESPGEGNGNGPPEDPGTGDDNGPPDDDDGGNGPPEDRGSSENDGGEDGEENADGTENEGDGQEGDGQEGDDGGDDEQEGDDGTGDDDRNDGEGTDGNGSDAASGELEARFAGNVTPGSTATVVVTREGDPVADATVFVDGTTVGSTNAEGRVTFGVPDVDSLTVLVTDGEGEDELEVEFEDRGGQGEDGP